MPTPIVMPQMGESIAEGTIVRWIKKVGDTVERDEPILEISTDKVDAEIPSPAPGVLTEIRAREGETVPVNAVIGMIGAPDEVSQAAGAAPQSKAPRAGQEAAAAPAGPEGAAAEAAPRQPPGAPGEGGEEEPSGPAARAPINGSARGQEPAAGDIRRQRSSPLVRRMAREHNIDIAQLQGSGVGGRVTKRDILDYLDGRAAAGALDQRPGARPAEAGRVEIRPLSVMRKKIAEHMVLSRRTAAHAHSVFHVNFSTVERIRQQKKPEYERLGAKLTYLAFIAKATVDALRRHPILNASLEGDNIIYKKDINLGIAVAIEGGLIVPVIRHADEKNMLGLCRAIADLAERARSKRLSPEEVQDGTFTITNHGQFGSQFGMPIINQPQAAILGVGIVEKRPIVENDAIAIRTMAYLTLGFDHRLIDGAVADQFMADIKERIERFDPAQV